MEEVVRYAKAKYHAVELTSDARNFMEERSSHKEGLVLLKSPDLLEGLQKVQKPISIYMKYAKKMKKLKWRLIFIGIS